MGFPAGFELELPGFRNTLVTQHRDNASKASQLDINGNILKIDEVKWWVFTNFPLGFSLSLSFWLVTCCHFASLHGLGEGQLPTLCIEIHLARWLSHHVTQLVTYSVHYTLCIIYIYIYILYYLCPIWNFICLSGHVLPLPNNPSETGSNCQMWPSSPLNATFKIICLLESFLVTSSNGLVAMASAHNIETEQLVCWTLFVCWRACCLRWLFGLWRTTFHPLQVASLPRQDLVADTPRTRKCTMVFWMNKRQPGQKWQTWGAKTTKQPETNKTGFWCYSWRTKHQGRAEQASSREGLWYYRTIPSPCDTEQEQSTGKALHIHYWSLASFGNVVLIFLSAQSR